MKDSAKTLDGLFRGSVAFMDAGDVASLERTLAVHTHLTTERLESPGDWLRSKVGGALDGFFQAPYLLWFVAEDPVRNGKLPRNIADVANLIVQTAKRNQVESLQEQLDYTLRLVCWSWIARECEVQIELLDVLIDTGASLDGRSLSQGQFGSQTDCACFNGNFEAAAHLLKRGAVLTFSTAICLQRWEDVDRMAATVGLDEKQDAFVLAAKHGKAESLRRMLALRIDPSTVSAQNLSHATALHHAVWSGALDAVQVLVEAGADLMKRDTIHNGTPLGWAEYAQQQQKTTARANQFANIAAYLRERMRNL